MKEIGLIQKILLFLMTPYYILVVLWMVICQEKAINPMRSGKISGTRKFKILEPTYSITKIKAKAKQLNCTFNDLMLTCSAVAFKKFMLKMGNKTTSNIMILIPVSFRGIKDFDLYNDIGTVPIKLPLDTDFMSLLPKV